MPLKASMVSGGLPSAPWPHVRSLVAPQAWYSGVSPLECMIIMFGDFNSSGPRSVVFRKTVDTGGTSAFKTLSQDLLYNYAVELQNPAHM